MKPRSDRRVLVAILLASLACCLLAACVTRALAQADGQERVAALYATDNTAAIADAIPGSDQVDDVFTAGRRSGFLFVAIGIGIAALSQAVLVRLKPKTKDGSPAPDTWRTKLCVVVGAASMVALAVVDMFAESRGLTPVTTAAIGALGLYRHSKSDPERGSKRATEDEGAPT